MSEQNTVEQTNAVDGNGEGAAMPCKLYAARADAEAAKPADAPKSLKPFEVLQNGTSKGWVLARGYDNGLAILARIDGYSLSTGKAAPVTKEAVAAKLAEFSDDELASMGLSRKPQKGARK
jgi:hypothetical protein